MLDEDAWGSRDEHQVEGETLLGGRQLGVWAGEGLGLKGCGSVVRFLLLQPVCSTDSVPCTLLPCPSINLNTFLSPACPALLLPFLGTCHTKHNLRHSHTSAIPSLSSDALTLVPYQAYPPKLSH